MTPIEVARVLESLADGIDVSRPDAWPEIGLGTAESHEIRLLLRENALAQAVERRRADPGLDWADGALLAVAHDSANTHRMESRHAEAKADFQRILELSPQDYNVRVALAAYADPHTEHQLIYELLRPYVEIYRREPAVYADALDLLARAAVTRGDLPTAARTPGVASSPYSERLTLLTTAPTTEPASIAETLLDHAILAMDEWTQIDCLEKALASASPEQAAASSFLTRAIFCARVSRHHNWARPYRACGRLVARALACGASSDVLVEEWTSQGLPTEALVALNQLAVIDPGGGVTATSPVAEAWLLALERAASRSGQDLPAGAAEWARLWRSGDFAQFLRLTPHGDTAKPKGEIWHAVAGLRRAALAVLDAPRTADMVDLWFFITWHEDPYQLFSLLSALVGERVVPVVSIGGDGLPSNLGVTSVALMLERFRFLFNPTVVWGGQRLLFQNVFIALEGFARRASETDRLQIICNRTYPLVAPDELCSLLAQPDFSDRFPGLPPPPIWHHEWPPELVDTLPDRFGAAMDAVFKNCDGAPFHDLSTYKGIFDNSDFRKNQVTFNFSSDAVNLHERYKSSSHRYLISGYSADMRWMSFGRLMEFIDTSSESMTTYSRRMHPIVTRWTHKVLSAHNLRTGDPFFLTTPKLAREVHTNPDCFELFTAMNSGFGPEMNFFDTLAMTEKYDLAGHAEHLYYRTPTGLALDSDVRGASYAADLERRLFVRKTTESDAAFIRFFADRIEADRGHSDYYLALTGSAIADAPTAKRWTAKDLLEDVLPGLVAEFRSLFEKPFLRVVFIPDGTLETADGERLAHWNWDAAGGLEIRFERLDWGVKRYAALTASDNRVTMPPEEAVSSQNNWGVFLDIDMHALLARRPQAQIIADNLWYKALLKPIACTGAALADIAMLGAFAAQADDRGVGVWRRHGYRFTGLCQTVDGRLSVAMEVDGVSTVGRIHRIAYGDGRAVPIIDFRPSANDGDWLKADDMSSVTASFGLSPDDCIGEWVLGLLDGDVAFILRSDGRIETATGEIMGAWTVRGTSLWILGLSEAPVIVASQFVWTEGLWTLSGWCSRGLGDLTSFSLKPTSDQGLHPLGEINP